MDQLLEVAIKAALQAGKRIMHIYEHEDFEVDFKGDDSPLTKADIAAHQVIVSHLENTDIPILSEEGKDIPYEKRKDWDKLWIVDPIDGTKEFIKRNGEFTVNIALVENQVPVIGVIYVPALKELYYAKEGLGAFKIDDIEEGAALRELEDKAQRLPISSDRSVYTVVASKSHLSPETEAYINNIRDKHGNIESISKGSSLKLCMVAEGKADCYPRFAPTMEWDTAAGQAICMYAGFKVIDYETKEEMLYNRANLLNNWFLVQ